MKSKFPKTIESRDLTRSDIPGESATWSEIARFALGWDFVSKYPKYSPEEQRWELVQDSWSLDDLRARLFFEQRRWNHFGRPPDEPTLIEIRRLVTLIRDKVQQEAK